MLFRLAGPGRNIPNFLKYIAIFLPFLEIAGFIIVGKAIGVGMTLLLIIASTIAGFSILRQQGNFTLLQMSRGSFSFEATSFRLMAAILLIIPGFITDIIGLVLLLKAHMSHNQQTVKNNRPAANDATHETIEGEFWKEDK